ncbi:MAG: hypothetical protein RML72_09340, partial [Bacteroidia bacterium]|nr:hypothetical protein [Bacteroidia bacterium]
MILSLRYLFIFCLWIGYLLVACQENEERELFFQEVEKTLQNYGAQLIELRLAQEQLIQQTKRLPSQITSLYLNNADSTRLQHLQQLSMEIQNLQAIQ